MNKTISEDERKKLYNAINFKSDQELIDAIPESLAVLLVIHLKTAEKCGVKTSMSAVLAMITEACIRMLPAVCETEDISTENSVMHIFTVLSEQFSENIQGLPTSSKTRVYYPRK